MAVFKVEKRNNFTVMNNYHLRDKNISHKARGLLSFMLSLPEDWDYSLSGLVSISKENKTAIRTALEELKENGYLIIDKIYPNETKSGRIEYIYNIYELPQIKQDTENLYLENLDIEKDTQINTNKLNDKEDKTKSSFFDAEEHNRLTLELIDKNYIDKNDIQLYFYDELFEELLKENSYIDLICIIHYILNRVKLNRFKDEDGNLISNKYGYMKQAIIHNIKRLNFDINDLWN